MDTTRYTELLERAKAESDRRLKAIFDGAHTFVILTLIDGSVVEINRSALEHRNLKREQVTGSALWDGPWLPADNPARPDLMHAMEDAALGDTKTFDAEIADSRGANKRFSITCQPVFGAHGHVLYLLVEAHDMTDFLQVQDRNHRLELEMMQNQKMESLGTLASGVAHEINTPMQYIRDNLDFLADGFGNFLKLLRQAAEIADAAQTESGVPPWLAGRLAQWRAAAEAADMDFLAAETPHAVRQSREGVDRVCAIVQAIKLFSRPDTAEMAPESLQTLVENVLTVSCNQWKYVARVETDFQPDMPKVFCHAGEISQVILHLIVNAAHAIEDKVGKSGAVGVIAVALRANGDNALLTVTDDGAGIDPDHYAKLFDPFFTTKDPGRGSGHGLSVCHAIVARKHGGALSFCSSQGKGSAFTVSLPIKPKPARSVDARQDEPL